MALQISWEIEGVTELSRTLIGTGTALKDYKLPFEQSASFLKSTFMRDVFDTQGAAIGEKWKRLSPYTVSQKARRGLPADPLIGTGRMRNSFQTIVSSEQAVVYNSAEYFKYHQSRAPRAHLPRRVMMKIAENQREQIVKYFQEYIRGAMRNQ